MNLRDLAGLDLAAAIKKVETIDPELAKRLRSLVSKDETDLTKFKVNVNFRLEKFEGEYTPESKPFEVIDGLG